MDLKRLFFKVVSFIVVLILFLLLTNFMPLSKETIKLEDGKEITLYKYPWREGLVENVFDPYFYIIESSVMDSRLVFDKKRNTMYMENVWVLKKCRGNYYNCTEVGVVESIDKENYKY